MAHDIFISYSHHDKPTADAIVAKFESEGLRCWYAPRDIAPGEDWAAAIIDGIKDSKVFVVVFTSYSNGSQQVLREIGLAVTKGMPIIPFKMTNAEPSKGMQYYLSTVHWLDAVDGQLYQNINVLGKRVRAVLGVDEEKKGEPADAAGPELSAPKQKKQPDKKKWINLVIALVILALIAVILWQMGVFGGKSTPESTKAPAAIMAETPTDVPTLEPTEEPTEVPTEAPTEEPTEVPTEAPTEAPIEAPTEEPTVVPTSEPTTEPTAEPTPEPTVEPTLTETEEPKQSEGSMAWPETENDYPELRDMSAAKRKMITKLIIAGDRVFINFNYDDYNTINDFTSAFLYDNKNNERITTNPGTLTDMSLIEGMEKMDALWLIDQPIKSLEGIEKLTNPMEIRILGCTNLEDVSPILEVTDIRKLDLVNNHVRAIGSIGKHKKLGAIYIFEPYMEDLCGLADWDVSYAEKEEGAELRLYCPLVQDYSFLRSIPSLSSLLLINVDSSLWINELDQTKIKELKENGCVKTQEDFDKLADSLISNHPEITTLCMINNPEITDLSKLTELPNLSAVTVSEDMWAAVTSLDNVNFQFDLRLND